MVKLKKQFDQGRRRSLHPETAKLEYQRRVRIVAMRSAGTEGIPMGSPRLSASNP